MTVLCPGLQLCHWLWKRTLAKRRRQGQVPFVLWLRFDNGTSFYLPAAPMGCLHVLALLKVCWTFFLEQMSVS